MTQGGQTRGQTSQTHWRSDAGEARHGGVLRKTSTGLGSSRAWARWRALVVARRTVVVAGPVVAGDDGNELDGGDRRRACVEKRLQGPR